MAWMREALGVHKGWIMVCVSGIRDRHALVGAPKSRGRKGVVPSRRGEYITGTMKAW